MKNLFILLLVFSFSQLSMAQKPNVKVKKDIVLVDDVPVFKLAYTFATNSLNLLNMNDEKLAIFILQKLYKKELVSSANPDGSVSYYEITFFNPDGDKCEVKVPGMKKQVAILILENNLVKDGKLQEQAVKQFVHIYGTKFSDEKNRTTKVIIENR